MKSKFAQAWITFVVIINFFSWHINWKEVAVAESMAEVQANFLIWLPFSGFFVVYFTIQFIKSLRLAEEAKAET